MYITLGKRIKLLRKQRKMTQEKLAETADISLSFVGHIERGTRKMSLETLIAIAHALDCTPNDLLGFTMGSPCEIRLSDLMISAAMMLSEEGK